MSVTSIRRRRKYQQANYLISVIDSFSDADIAKLKEAVTVADDKRLGRVITQVKGKYSDTLKKRFDYLKLKPTSEKITWVHASHLSNIVDTTAVTFFEDGLIAARHFDTPLQNIRILTACIYAAAKGENGSRAKASIKLYAQKLTGQVQPLRDIKKELDNGVLFLVPNPEVFADILLRMDELSALASTYTAENAKKEDSDAALSRLRELADLHEEDIFKAIDSLISTFKKRGRPKEPDILYLGEWGYKIREKKKKGKSAEFIGHEIYSALDSRSIRVGYEEAVHARLKRYFEPLETEGMDAEMIEDAERRRRESLAEVVNSAIRAYNDSLAIQTSAG